MDSIKHLILKYKSFILYVFFGGCTTLVNILVYAICSRKLGMGTVTSNVCAWILAVTFAYITNRIWVFESNKSTLKGVIRELTSFFSCRLLTGGLDILIMYVFVDVLAFNDMVIKVISNVVVILLNYVASKVLIFQHDNKAKEGNI